MSNFNFKDISYLSKGNIKQRKSYEILKKINIFNILYEFKPILVGTIPIEIDIENSDLDIICEVTDFTIRYNKENSVLVCNFKVEITLLRGIAEIKSNKIRSNLNLNIWG